MNRWMKDFDYRHDLGMALAFMALEVWWERCYPAGGWDVEVPVKKERAA